MGSHFILVRDSKDLLSSAEALPGDELLIMEFLHARGADGMTRKYRVMIIGGELYPLHLAISKDWKVHYFSAAMATDQAFRNEEQRFLEDMPAALGARAIGALLRIGVVLGLDYAGIDFGLRADGSILLFEANATMVIAPPPPSCGHRAGPAGGRCAGPWTRRGVSRNAQRCSLEVPRARLAQGTLPICGVSQGMQGLSRAGP
jgi:hypothetical protein